MNVRLKRRSGSFHVGRGSVGRMIATGEYRGVPFSIPHNDDGVWHYKIFPRRDRRLARGQPRPTAVEGYPTREAAVAAAKKAIDGWLAAATLSTGTTGDRGF